MLFSCLAACRVTIIIINSVLLCLGLGIGVSSGLAAFCPFQFCEALKIENVLILFYVGFGFGITMVFVSIFGLFSGCCAGCVNSDKVDADDCCGRMPYICTKVCIPIYLVLISIILLFSCLLASVFSAIYFRGDAQGCPKLLMTDQILCLPNEAKCEENWSPIYANKPQPPKSYGELMSLECPLDFAISYSTIFAADNTTGKESWVEIQNLFYACGYYCGTYYSVDDDGRQIGETDVNGDTCKNFNEFSRQMTGDYCRQKVPSDAEPLDLMVYNGEQDELEIGKPSTSPLRATIINIFKTYGLPVIILLWMVVATDIVVMVSTIIICRVVTYKKKGGRRK